MPARCSRNGPRSTGTTLKQLTSIQCGCVDSTIRGRNIWNLLWRSMNATLTSTENTPRNVLRGLVALLLPLAMLMACTSATRPTQETSVPTRSPLEMPASTSSSLMSPTNTPPPCPVTIPNRSVPPGVSNWSPSPVSHGNGVIWVEISPKILATPDYVGFRWFNTCEDPLVSRDFR